MKLVQKKKIGIAALTIIFCIIGLLMSKTAFSGDCEVHKEFVIDHSNGLMWQRSPPWLGKVKYKEAESQCRSTFAGGHNDWRLPTLDELRSLRNSPCMQHLPNVIKNYYYWSSDAGAAFGFCKDPLQEQLWAYYTLNMGTGEKGCSLANLMDLRYRGSAFDYPWICVRSID